jgi:hypothetical protein
MLPGLPATLSLPFVNVFGLADGILISFNWSSVYPKMLRL